MKRFFAAAVLAAAIPAAASAATAQVGGDWAVTLATDQGNLPVACHFDQADAALTGTCGGGASGGGMAPSNITGTVTDANFTLAYDVTFGGTPLHVVYTGHSVADGTIAGTFAAGPYNGTFTGMHAAAAEPAAAPAAPAPAAPPVAH
jgi:hypothetical protein